MNQNPNTSIHCTVDQCAHHCGTRQYCTLQTVQIGSHECDPTRQQCVDCQSFQRK